MSKFPKKDLTVGGDDPFLPSLLDAINHATEISITAAFIRMTGVANGGYVMRRSILL